MLHTILVKRSRSSTIKVNIKKGFTYQKDKETPVLQCTVFKINIQIFLINRLKFVMFVVVKKHLTNKKFIYNIVLRYTTRMYIIIVYITNTLCECSILFSLTLKNLQIEIIGSSNR